MDKPENTYKVTVFTPFEFHEGQKIFIENGRLHGKPIIADILKKL